MSTPSIYKVLYLGMGICIHTTEMTHSDEKRSLRSTENKQRENEASFKKEQEKKKKSAGFSRYKTKYTSTRLAPQKP